MPSMALVNFFSTRRLVSAVAVALALLAAGCAGGPDRAWHWPRFTPHASENMPRASHNRIVFDHACKLTSRHFHDPAFGGRDWPAIREKFRVEALAARNTGELYDTLNAMLGELGSSHATAIPPDIVRMQKTVRDDAVSLSGYVSLKLPGLEMPVVYEVTPGGPAAEAGIRRGWLEAGRMQRAAPDTPVREGEVVRQDFIDEHDTPRTVTMTLRAVPGPGAGKTAELLPGGVLHLRFDRFDGASARWVREQLKAHGALGAGLRGVVLDLRLNGGGQVAACRRVLGEFFTTPAGAGAFIDRRGRATAVEARAGGRSARYTGPLAVLVARMSGSGAEVFAAAIQETNRGVIVGSTSTGRTAGAVLMSMDFPLPGGGRLQLPVRNFRTAAGARLEGAGVRADVEAPLPTVASLRAGEDPALARAVEAVLALAGASNF